jgi:hypothetical protein
MDSSKGLKVLGEGGENKTQTAHQTFFEERPGIALSKYYTPPLMQQPS